METNSSYLSEQIDQHSQYYESAESGLNLVDIKDNIFLQIHIIAGTTICMSSLAVFSAIRRPPTYQARFEILSEPVNLETKVTSSISQSKEITAVALDEVQLKKIKKS